MMLQLMPKSGTTKKASVPGTESRKDHEPFVAIPRTLGLKPGIDPDKISHYADEMCDTEKLRKSLS